MFRSTTCATRAEMAFSVGTEDGQTSANLADVRLILFYNLRKKCRIPRISNDESKTYFIVSKEVSPQLMHQNLHRRWWCSHSDYSSDLWSRPCALLCIRQKPLPITNHGGFGTRPPSNARERTHLTRSGHSGCRDDLIDTVAHAVDRRRWMRGCRLHDVATTHHLRARKLGSTISTPLTLSNARSGAVKTRRTPWVQLVVYIACRTRSI